MKTNFLDGPENGVTLNDLGKWSVEIQRMPLYRMSAFISTDINIKDDKDNEINYFALPVHLYNKDRTMHFFAAEEDCIESMNDNNISVENIDRIKNSIKNFEPYIQDKKPKSNNQLEPFNSLLKDLQKILKDDSNEIEKDNNKKRKLLELSLHIIFKIEVPHDWYENGIVYRLLKQNKGLLKPNGESKYPVKAFTWKK